jgi:hypothetical protein
VLGSIDNSTPVLQQRQPVGAVDRISVKYTGRLSQANGIFASGKIEKASVNTKFLAPTARPSAGPARNRRSWKEIKKIAVYYQSVKSTN